MFDGCIHQFLILKNKWLSDKSSQFLIQSQIDWLVVLSHPSEKYEFVSWISYSQLNGKS